MVPFRRRPRWSVDALTRLPPTATPRSVAWGNGLSFLAGGAIVVASLVLPGAPARGSGAILAMALGCVASGSTYLLIGHHLPRWVLNVSLATATVMVSYATWLADGGAMSLIYPTLYILVLANAFSLCSWAASLGHLLWVIAWALVAMQTVPAPREAPVFVLLGMIVVVCANMGRLMRAVGTAEVDALTGLPNRRAMERRMEQEMARTHRSGAALALALVDLDHFKDVNDRLGHAAGDRLLRDVARAWTARTPDGAMLARWGGDEFVLLMPEATSADAVRAVAHLRSGMPHGASCTAGAATWAHGEPASRLTSRADAALYEAKRACRGTTETAPDGEVDRDAPPTEQAEVTEDPRSVVPDVPDLSDAPSTVDAPHRLDHPHAPDEAPASDAAHRFEHPRGVAGKRVGASQRR